MNIEKSINYGKQYIDNEDIESVIEILKSDYLTQGPSVENFEKCLAKYVNAKYCVVLNSGTSALHAAYFALGLQKNDEIITSPMTFAATSNAALYLGAKPVFSEIENDTGNINTSEIEKKISDKTRIITPVHYGGHPADMEKVYSLAKKYNLSVVEDACHALGAEYKNEKIGNCKYSDIAVFSFHPVKHITTGEGGAILTNDKKIYEKALTFRTHGITKTKMLNSSPGDWYYEMQHLGFNYRMTDIQAALGNSQLRKLEDFIERRREIVEIYNKNFNNNPYFYTPSEKNYAKSAYHLYAIRLKEKYLQHKQQIFNDLRKRRLWVQVHYIPVYLHPYYQSIGYNKVSHKITEKFYQSEISLPLFPKLTSNEIQYITDSVFSVFENL